MKTEDLIKYGLIGLVLYLLYQKFGNAFGPGSAPAAAGGNLLQHVFNPTAANYQAGTSYAVVFPDGSRHAVDSATVASDGTFTWPTDGQVYVLFTGVTGTHAAVLAESIIQTGRPASNDPNAPDFTAPGVAGMR